MCWTHNIISPKIMLCGTCNWQRKKSAAGKQVYLGSDPNKTVKAPVCKLDFCFMHGSEHQSPHPVGFWRTTKHIVSFKKMSMNRLSKVASGYSYTTETLCTDRGRVINQGCASSHALWMKTYLGWCDVGIVKVPRKLLVTGCSTINRNLLCMPVLKNKN